MDFDEDITNEEQFWDELDDIVSTPCRTHDRIDDTLRTWLAFAAAYKDSYLQTELSLNRCSLALLASTLFSKNAPYIRRQLVECLLQEDDAVPLHLLTAFLTYDGRSNEETYRLMSSEGVFPRLMRLVKDGTDDEAGLHRLMIELLYEMSRVQQLSYNDLTTIDDAFVVYLFQIVESLSNDVHDPYHHPILCILLVLNEQYMVSSNTPSHQPVNVTNRVVKALSLHGRLYKTFGENLILLLNRESETSLQLMILKLLYLLFTTSTTQEYFYTNDLYVLADILTRNLLDLPSPTIHPAATPLRHTYLRVLHPLLANTQLRLPPHYRRDELRKVLSILADAGSHFEAPDETTLRLIKRCMAVDWLRDEDMPPEVFVDQPSPTDEDAESRLEPGKGLATVAKRALGMGLPEARGSSLSVAEMATHKEKPGVLSPSKGRDNLEEPASPFEDTPTP